MKHNVLLIGSGGREHALAWKISQSPLLGLLFCAPGNAGIEAICTCVELAVEDHVEVLTFCQEKDISLVVIGPEAPLVAGLTDDLVEAGISVFGPSQAAAQLEGSKAFTKQLCDEFDIPTAASETFNNAPKARAYLRQQSMPIVVKADGLAAGKGVIIAENLSDACDAVDACFEGEFGEAGARVVIEEFLVGEEASLFAMCDGNSANLIGTAQDHKRAFDGDKGPNTGGMGAYSPASILTQDLIDEVMSDIIMPTLAGMHSRGTPFTGFLYAGLMLTKDGPQLIEYNVRFGDPECQVIMMRMQSDLLELMLAACNNELLEHVIEWDDRAALTVVMASKGYPGEYQKNTIIKNADADFGEDVFVFHAGTQKDGGKLTAIGGRVLNVTALGKSVSDARDKAYAAVDTIDWPEGFCRRDIGWREMEREKS